MNSHLSIRRSLARLFAAAVFALISFAALAQADPPGRIGRINFSQGSLSFSPAGDNEWIEAQPNRPLTKGDRLWTDRGSRAEIQIGSSAVRLDGQTRLDVMVLDDQSAQLSLTQGSLYVRVRSLPDGENFEIDTPNLAYRAAYPGDYRIDVDAADATTRVTIHSGTGAVYGQGGQAMPLGGGQQITFRGRSLVQVATQESPPQDAFDRWAAERNRLEDQSIAARYVPREVVGYQQLDAHGQWKKDATHGAVWYPHGTPADWAPYRNGRWEWIDPWGWTWIDDAPWGFAPFHYGRWALIESRWAWVPGSLGLRPVYAPALVAFVGSSSGSSILTSLAGRSSVAWFPLAPGEMWQPGFRASGAYVSSVNRSMLPGSSDATYTYQRRPEALTAVSGDDFQRGRPAGAGWLRIAADALTSAAVVPPPPKPERTAVAKAGNTRSAPPPTPPEVRRVNANPAAAAQAEAIQRNAAQRTEQARAAEQAKVAEQAKASQQAKMAKQAKPAEQARAAEEVKAAQQAKAAEQAKEAAQAKAVAQAEAAAQANAVAQAKAAEQARASEQAKAVAQVKAAEQAKASAQARVAEQARRSEQARQSRLTAQEQAKAVQKAQLDQQRKAAEQARLAAQAKLAERTRRAEVAKFEAQQARHGRRTQTAAPETAATKHVQAQLAQRGRKQQLAMQAETAKHEQQARRAGFAHQEAQARRKDRALAQAKRDEQQRVAAQARHNEELQRIAHAQRVEQARRSAERDAQALREQRVQRELLARREQQEAQRQALQRQQAAAEQLRREQQAREEQLERARARPDLRDPRNRPPEVWQRGIPILNSGRTS